MKPIVIIGAGTAGYSVARELRKLDPSTPLTMLTSDAGHLYSKPMLSNALAKNLTQDGLITQTAERMAKQLTLDIQTEVNVQNIDTERQIITTSRDTYAYEKVILAIGAKPIRLPLQGNAAHEVLSINNLHDYSIFLSAIGTKHPSAHVTILGAGLIGCEFANDLATSGHSVSVIDPNVLPLAALAPPTLSQGLMTALMNIGTQFHLGTTATTVNRIDDKLHVLLANGNQIKTDVVLSAIGLRPNLELAQRANLKIARGIIVNQLGQTSAPDIYALGDCAEYTYDETGNTRTMPYIAPLLQASQAISRSLTGQPTHIDLTPTSIIVKTPSYRLALFPPPINAKASGNWSIEENDTQTICRCLDQKGKMIGFGYAPYNLATQRNLMDSMEKH